MATKPCTIEAYMRDENDTIIWVESAYGTTEDEGQTVLINYGYVPNIHTMRPGDVKVTVHNPPVFFEGSTFVSRSDDQEANQSTLTFQLGGQ